MSALPDGEKSRPLFIPLQREFAVACAATTWLGVRVVMRAALTVNSSSILVSLAVVSGASLGTAEAQTHLPEIQVCGRAERATDGWRATWPAVAWRAAFSGTAIAVLTKDASAYRVEIDGREMGPIAPSQEPTESWYRALQSGDHLVEVIRKNVTRETPGQFFGFRLDAAISRGARIVPMMPFHP
jgi:hypothetical protein